MEQIADESGLAVTALYCHFDSKEELFQAAFCEVRDEVDRLVEDNRPPNGTLRDVLGIVFRWARDHPERANLLWVFSAGATPAMATLWEEFIARHIEGTQRYRLTDADRDVDPDRLAARTAVIAGNVIALHWISGDMFGDVEPERMTEVVASMMERMFTIGT